MGRFSDDSTISDTGFFIGEKPIGGNDIFDKSLADAIVSYLKKNNIEKIADFGCGCGQYTFHFEKNKIRCDGFDGNPNTPTITKNKCKVLDLSKTFKSEKKWEYIVSLEVAEHLPQKFEKTFIENLHENNTKGIILSWAVIGQGGHGHFNERNNDYVKNLFEQLGYYNDDNEENILRNNASVRWFKNTIMIFKKKLFLWKKYVS